ncbi:MAG: hypothetical protein HOP11_03425 [Saprospiraceae bacterium]|nr:hypothetical protein [Saprospiraceae bacterium]
MRIIFIWWFAVLPIFIFSQPLPTTNLYSLVLQSDKNFVIENVEFLNSFNFKSYNNQPYFINDDEIVCTIKTNTSSSTDIYRLNLKDKTYTNLISNSGNDYSPRLHPEIKNGITCVHVPENDTTQYLVVYNEHPYENYTTLLQNPGQVGYYRFYKEKIWVCFLVDQPYNLLAIIGPDSKKIFASEIGRTFEVVNEQIYFVHKILKDEWILKSYDVESEKMNRIANMPAGSEDFVILDNGDILCSAGGTILKLNKSRDVWELVFDLSGFGLNHIGRFSIRTNRLVLVNEIK